MLDRVWWIWQMQDPDTRTPLIPNPWGSSMSGMGHGHMKREGLESTVANEDIVDMLWIAPKVALSKRNDPLGGADGQFCYYYV